MAINDIIFLHIGGEIIIKPKISAFKANSALDHSATAPPP